MFVSLTMQKLLLECDVQDYIRVYESNCLEYSRILDFLHSLLSVDPKVELKLSSLINELSD